MRTLLLTLLAAAPLLAQEAEEQTPAEQAEKEKQKTQDKAAEIRKLVETFLDRKDTKRLEELEKRLRALLKEDPLWLGFQPVTSKQMRFVFTDTAPGAQETISGSLDGTSYTLKSLGGGKYRLTATQKLDDDETKKITDEGTLKDLRKKYPFLRNMAAAVWTVGELDPLAGFREAPKARLGMWVRPPSEVLSYHLELPTGAGLVVGSVVTGSRAERLGLKKHDVLLRIDGELIDAPDQLEKLARNEGVLEYIRRGKLRQLDLSKLADEK
jgi:hypothetical protein